MLSEYTLFRININHGVVILFFFEYLKFIKIDLKENEHCNSFCDIGIGRVGGASVQRDI